MEGDDVQNVYVAFESPKEEAIFGLGEQAGLGNLRGMFHTPSPSSVIADLSGYRIPIWTREGGAGRGEEPLTTYLNEFPAISGTFAGGSTLTTYTAIASMVTSIGRWLVLDGNNYALFDLASENRTEFEDTAQTYLEGVITAGDKSSTNVRTIEIMYEGTSMIGHVGRTRGLLDGITALTEVTGRQPALPEWAGEGAILGIQGGQTKVESIVQASINYSMPVVSVWLQDWCGTRLQAGLYNISISRLWWNWEPDKVLYPTWSSWVPHLLDQYDVRTLTYINTFLANVSAKTTGYTNNYYVEATAEGRFVQNATAGDNSTWIITSGPGIDAGLIDISNDTTVDWLKALIKQQFYSVRGVSGAMQDFGEYLAVDSSVQLTNGKGVTAREFHNAYPGDWADLLRSVVKELGIADDVVGFHRSANTYSAQNTNLFWAGDQNIDWTREDGMRAVISSTFHMGFSGFGIMHSDVGGYTTILAPTFNLTRSPALLGRWGEMSAFSGAVFRTHEGNIPSVNTQFYSNATTYIYHSYNARLFVALKPYRDYLSKQYQDLGWPLVRHPTIYAPHDVVASKVVDEIFFFGSAILVAPVYSPADQAVTAYLPKISGEYQHLWSGKRYKSGQNVTVEAPYGKLGVFIRQPLHREEAKLLANLFEFVKKEKDTVLSVA